MNSEIKFKRFLQPAYQKWSSLSINRKRHRKKIALPYFTSSLNLARDWAKQRTETDNFYYQLTPENMQDLASLIATITGSSPDQVDRYIVEIQEDSELRDHLSSSWAHDPNMRDAQFAYGRRIGWYAFARILKPKLIIETGVHHGIGACVLTSALIQNRIEGSPGRYLGTDIDPDAGSLFTGKYAGEGTIEYGDSIATLSKIDTPIDFFINDSDHSAEYEAQEYETIMPSLAAKSIVLGDNSHTNNKLNEFSRRTGRPYVFFREAPLNHWYPGAGIGISPSTIPLTLR